MKTNLIAPGPAAPTSMAAGTELLAQLRMTHPQNFIRNAYTQIKQIFNKVDQDVNSPLSPAPSAKDLALFKMVQKQIKSIDPQSPDPHKLRAAASTMSQMSDSALSTGIFGGSLGGDRTYRNTLKDMIHGLDIAMSSGN